MMAVLTVVYSIIVVVAILVAIGWVYVSVTRACEALEGIRGVLEKQSVELEGVRLELGRKNGG